MSSPQPSLIAGRYAGALFDSATAARAVDEVQADMQQLAALAAENAEFNTLLTSPLIARKDGAQAVNALLTKAKAHKITVQFVTMLAENRRLALLPAIATRLAEQVEESRGELTADVEAAAALDASIQKQVIDALAKSTGKKVKLRIHENPALLGGLVVRFQGKRLDLSVAGRLDRLSQSLRSA